MPCCISSVISQNRCSDISHINAWINCHCWSHKVIYSKVTLVTQQYKVRTSTKIWYSEYKPELPTLEPVLLLFLISSSLSVWRHLYWLMTAARRCSHSPSSDCQAEPQGMGYAKFKQAFMYVSKNAPIFPCRVSAGHTRAFPGERSVNM